MTRRLAPPGYALFLTLLVTAPLLAPGYLLLRDAVSTPRSHLSDAALGLSEAAPRALPQDFAVALLSHLVDGGIVVKALLVAALWLAGCGAARLVAVVLPEAGLAGQLVAVTLSIWNPYVAERLLQGHWSLLVGYGCLPWVAATMLALRSEGARTWPGFFGLMFWIALAGVTPTGLMLAATVALVAVAAPGAGRGRWLCGAAALSMSVLAALPWLVASTVGGSLSTYQESGVPGVEAFAARAEPGLGTLGSLAGLGGIWNAEAVPGSRTTLFAVVATVVLLGVVVAGLPVAARRPAAVPFLVLAAMAVVAPAAMATSPGLATVHAVLEAVPGLGVLRDGQKWVALAVPGYALAASGAVVTLARRAGAKRLGGVVRWRPAIPTGLAAGACCAAVIFTQPDLVWGAWGSITPVRYPPGWAAVAAQIDAEASPVAVLPADSMRQFAWSGPAPVLDPLPRWVRADVLSTGDLAISGQTVPGEGGAARTVQRLLLGGADPGRLADEGVGWVLVEFGTGGEMGSAARTLEQLPITYRDADMTLYRVGGDSRPTVGSERRAVVAAHLVWLGMLIAGTVGSVTGWTLRRRTSAGVDET